MASEFDGKQRDGEDGKPSQSADSTKQQQRPAHASGDDVSDSKVMMKPSESSRNAPALNNSTNPAADSNSTTAKLTTTMMRNTDE